MNGLTAIGRESFKIHMRVADQLGLSVVRGDYSPGAVIPTEAVLCETFAVSRTAVREAIRGLIAKGLVESRSKIGTRVRQPEYWNHMDPDVLKWRLAVSETGSYLQKMFNLRGAVEPAASALAAEAATSEDHRRIDEAFRAMVAAGADDGLWVDADIAFHKAIYIATQNEFFWPIGQLFEIGLREMFMIAAKGSHRARAIKEHGELRDAIIAGDAARARKATFVLLGNAEDDIRRIRSMDQRQSA